MSELDRAAAESALHAVYQNVTTVADGLSDADLMRPSRCAGWALGDVLYHQLLDARRALRTFASPSAEPPDVDDVGYWRSYSPEGEYAPRQRGGGRACPARPDRGGRLSAGGPGVGVAGDRGRGVPGGAGLPA